MKEDSCAAPAESRRTSVSDWSGLPLWLLATLAVAGGLFAASQPQSPFWTYLTSPQGAATLILAAILGVVAWQRPDSIPLLLTFFVFTNVSQVLVREFDWPSILQPVMLALVCVAVGRTSPDRWRSVALLPLTLALSLLTLMTFASSLWAVDPVLSDLKSLESLKSLIIYALLAATAVTSILIVRSAWAMVMAATVLAALGVFQVATGRYDLTFFGLARVKDAHIYGSVFEPRIAGPLGDPNFFAQILLVAFPVALALSWFERRTPVRIAGWLAALVISAAVVFTYSRGAMIAAAVQVLVALHFHRNRARLLSIAAVAAVLSLLLLPSEFTSRLTTVKQLLPGNSEALNPDSSFEERRLFTLTAWEMFLEHPLLGVGAGNYEAHFDEYASRVGTPLRSYDDPHRAHFPHNLYLELAAESGLPGLGLFLLAVGFCIAMLIHSRTIFLRSQQPELAGLALALLVALAGYLVSSLFLHGHFQRYLWLVFGFTGAVFLKAVSEASTDAAHPVVESAGTSLETG